MTKTTLWEIHQLMIDCMPSTQGVNRAQQISRVADSTKPTDRKPEVLRSGIKKNKTLAI